MTPRHVRTLRGAAAAWVATIVAATSHTLAGGGAPAPLLVAVVGILAWPIGIALVGRRLSVSHIASAVVASQLLFHVAFAVVAGADPSAAAGHVHHLVLDGGGLTVALVPDAPMLLAHALAAVATLLGLYGGERMLRALGRGIRSVVQRSDVVPLAPRTVVRSALAHFSLAPARGVVLSDLSRRGPPSFVDAVV
ncbi:hypothetical protein [Microbacterium sp. SSM24]|uniref:hypothetical protein n=1 Tax=Microbacterium sp. SSM24 TaxID=2991714 RepID=UPI002227880F|nr:hypothetical protein [Microbacterium sp. SSM24]MCW3493946.1 hypothetical protein [Microbacterium sp. SSM24]